MKIYVCKITLFCLYRQSLGEISVTFAAEIKHKQGYPDVNRYFIYLGYNGKKFCGWQIQPNGITVQQSIEEALATLLLYKIPGKLDFEAMNKACSVLFDYIDFTSFSKLHTDVKTNNCRIYKAGWEREGDVWVFTIQADRFLRNMVRAIVGTLLEVGRGKLTVDGFRQVIEAKDRGRAGTSAPGHALYLVDVTYPEELFQLAVGC